MVATYQAGGKAAVLRINQDPTTWGAYSVRLSAQSEQSAKRGQSDSQQNADTESAKRVQTVSKTRTELSAKGEPLNLPFEDSLNGLLPADDPEGSAVADPEQVREIIEREYRAKIPKLAGGRTT